MKEEENNKTEDWEEECYQIAESVRVPDCFDSTKEMSLFDFQMEEGREDEGIELANKIKSIIKDLLSQQKEELREKIENVKIDHKSRGHVSNCTCIENLEKLLE